MGKTNKVNIHRTRKIINNSSTYHYNGQSALGLVEDTKSISKNVCPAVTGRFKVVDQEHNLPVSSLGSLRITSKKKRKKMGQPVIVEDTAAIFPSVPAPLRHKVTAEPFATSLSPGTFVTRKKINSKQSRNRACITIAECIKPNAEPKQNGHGATESVEKGEPVDTERPQVASYKETSPAPVSSEIPIWMQNMESVDPENPQDFTDYSIPPPSNREGYEKHSPRFYCFRNKVLAIMETDAKFCFHGKLKVRVLYGTVRIYGFTLSDDRKNSFVTIYSPRAYSPVAIESIDNEITHRSLSDVWNILGVECDDGKLANRLQSDISDVEEGWAVLLMENFDNQLTNFLAAHFPHHLFPRIDDPSNHSWRDPRRAEIVLQSNLRFDDTYRKTVIDSKGIDDVADAIRYNWEMKESSKTVLAGGKGVGKSTAARYLVNKLLGTSESVVFLDLDPGQAEFTPSGSISLTIVEEPLLGPNFTHLRTPYFELYLGSVDVTRCLTRYTEGIKKLVDRLNDDPRLAHRPVVVNTMGFCKGIGWDIMSYVIKILSPTDVIQIMSRRSKNNFDDTLSRQVIDRQSLGWMTWKKNTSIAEKSTRHRLHVIYSEAETGTGSAESWNLEAHQQRDLAMISYLSGIGNCVESAMAQVRGPTSTINATPPYVIPFAAVSVSIVGAFVPQVLSVLNGNIVALCGVDAESTEKSIPEGSITSSYPRILIKPPLSTCYGFGILRGVDMEKEQMFLSTPLPRSHMKHVNCLIGIVNVPRCLLQVNQQGAPYTSSEYDLPTSRGPRRGYVRTRYQTDT